MRMAKGNLNGELVIVGPPIQKRPLLTPQAGWQPRCTAVLRRYANEARTGGGSRDLPGREEQPGGSEPR